MKTGKKHKMEHRISNLSAKFKTRYPHLYESAGGRYIRQIIKNLLNSTRTAEPDYMSAGKVYKIEKSGPGHDYLAHASWD